MENKLIKELREEISGKKVLILGFGREGKTGPNREGSKTFLSYLDRNEWCGKDGGAEDSGGLRI